MGLPQKSAYCFQPSHGPFLRIFVKEVTSGHEIESETGDGIDPGAFGLIS